MACAGRLALAVRERSARARRSCQSDARGHGVAGAVGGVGPGLGVGLLGDLGRVGVVHDDALLGGVDVLVGRDDVAGGVQDLLEDDELVSLGQALGVELEGHLDGASGSKGVRAVTSLPSLSRNGSPVPLSMSVPTAMYVLPGTRPL